jgi:hypothetical protein
LSSTTLALASSGHLTVQTTRQSIVLVNQHQRYGRPSTGWRQGPDISEG